MLDCWGNECRANWSTRMLIWSGIKHIRWLISVVLSSVNIRLPWYWLIIMFNPPCSCRLVSPTLWQPTERWRLANMLYRATTAIFPWSCMGKCKPSKHCITVIFIKNTQQTAYWQTGKHGIISSLHQHGNLPTFTTSTSEYLGLNYTSHAKVTHELASLIMAEALHYN